MTYQATTDRTENPFQQFNNQDDNFEDEEDNTHNIKFTIPPNSNEKGKKLRLKVELFLDLYFLTILCSPFLQLSGITS